MFDSLSDSGSFVLISNSKVKVRSEIKTPIWKKLCEGNVCENNSLHQSYQKKKASIACLVMKLQFRIEMEDGAPPTHLQVSPVKGEKSIYYVRLKTSHYSFSIKNSCVTRSLDSFYQLRKDLEIFHAKSFTYFIIAHSQ